MSRFVERGYQLTISNGTAFSAAISNFMTAGQMKIVGHSISGITVQSPAVLAEACVVQVNLDESTVGDAWANWQSAPGVDAALVAAKAVSFAVNAVRDFRIGTAAGGNVAADRTFLVTFQLTASGT